MRIVIWGINYAPEPTGIGPFNTGMAEWFASCGHDVEVVTAFPYYPRWKKRPDDRSRLFRTDQVNGVTVRRCWHYVPEKVTTVRRILHEASFLLFSFLRVLFLRRADVIVAVSPPLPLGLPVWLVSRLWRVPYFLHVQDLQPDAAVGLGMLKPGLFTRLLYAIESFSYRGAAGVSGISSGMMNAFQMKGVEARRRVYFPNWVPDERPARCSAEQRAAVRAEFCRQYNIPTDTFLYVYSGNIGNKQGLSVLVDAAARAKSSRPLWWVVAGDGAGKAALVRHAGENAVANMVFLPLQSDDGFEALMVAADACVITQQKGTGQYFFPSKLLTSLSRRKPILAVADHSSELAQAVVEGSLGVVVPPDDVAAVAHAAAAMAEASVGQLTQWGRNGATWVGRFARHTVLSRFARTVEHLSFPQDRTKGRGRRLEPALPTRLKATPLPHPTN